MATIGVFDGVHRGHQELIGRAVELAAERGLPSVVVTFDPHPSEVVRPGSHPAQLTTLRRKAELVEELGVDVFCVLPFTMELSKLPADEFVHELLVDRLHVAAVVVGENFTFGNKAAGNVELLTALGQRFGFVTRGAKLVTEHSTDAGEITYSSTYTRACIDAGDVESAAAALGRPHRLEGIVVRGDGRGHELGFPTANLSTPALRGRARRRRLRLPVHPAHPVPQAHARRGGVGGHQSDLLRPGAPGGGVRARRGRGLLRAAGGGGLRPPIA